MQVYIKMPDEVNKERKALNLTWRDLIMSGLQARRDPNFKPESSVEETYKDMDKALKTFRTGFTDLINIRDRFKPQSSTPSGK